MFRKVFSNTFRESIIGPVAITCFLVFGFLALTPSETYWGTSLYYYKVLVSWVDLAMFLTVLLTAIVASKTVKNISGNYFYTVEKTTSIKTAKYFSAKLFGLAAFSLLAILLYILIEVTSMKVQGKFLVSFDVPEAVGRIVLSILLEAIPLCILTISISMALTLIFKNGIPSMVAIILYMVVFYLNGFNILPNNEILKFLLMPWHYISETLWRLNNPTLTQYCGEAIGDFPLHMGLLASLYVLILSVPFLIISYCLLKKKEG